MIREIDESPSDSIRGECAHRVTADANMFHIYLAGKRRDALLQNGQGVQNKRNVLRTALPERWLLKRVTHGYQEVDVLFSRIAALHGGIIVRGLQHDVTVSGPVPRKSFAAGLRPAGAMGKNDNRIGPWFIRIKNADMEILVPLGVVKNDVRYFCDGKRTVRQLVSPADHWTRDRICNGARRKAIQGVWHAIMRCIVMR
jgi:hypothetical protein